MVNPITWTQITNPTLDTSGFSSASDRLSGAFGSITDSAIALQDTAKKNRIIKRNNVFQKEAERLAELSRAGEAEELNKLRGINLHGLGSVNDAGQIEFNPTRERSQLKRSQDFGEHLIRQGLGNENMPELVQQYPDFEEKLNDPGIAALIDRSTGIGGQLIEDKGLTSFGDIFRPPGAGSTVERHNQAIIDSEKDELSEIYLNAGVDPNSFDLGGTELHKGSNLTDEQVAENDNILRNRIQRNALIRGEEVDDAQIDEIISYTHPVSEEERQRREAEVEKSVNDTRQFFREREAEVGNYRSLLEDRRQGSIAEAQQIRDEGAANTLKERQAEITSFIKEHPKYKNVDKAVIDQYKDVLTDLENDRVSLDANEQSQLNNLNKISEASHVSRKKQSQTNLDRLKQDNPITFKKNDFSDIIEESAVLAAVADDLPTEAFFDTDDHSGGVELINYIREIIDEGYTDENGDNHRYTAQVVKAGIDRVATDKKWVKGKSATDIKKEMDKIMPVYLNEEGIREEIRQAEDAHEQNLLKYDTEFIQQQGANQAAVRESAGIFDAGDANTRDRSRGLAPLTAIDRAAALERGSRESYLVSGSTSLGEELGLGGMPVGDFLKGTGTGAGDVSTFVSNQIKQMIRESSTRHGLNPREMLAIAEAESQFNPSARNEKGTSASGVYQITTGTWNRPNIGQGNNRFDPQANIDAAMRLAVQNKFDLENSLDESLDVGHVFLLHQQGLDVATKLLVDPSKTIESLPTVISHLPKSLEGKKAKNITRKQYVEAFIKEHEARINKY